MITVSIPLMSTLLRSFYLTSKHRLLDLKKFNTNLSESAIPNQENPPKIEPLYLISSLQ